MKKDKRNLGRQRFKRVRQAIVAIAADKKT